MKIHSWINGVLSDIEQYALANDLMSLASSVRETQTIFTDEQARQPVPSDISCIASQLDEDQIYHQLNSISSLDRRESRTTG